MMIRCIFVSTGITDLLQKIKDTGHSHEGENQLCVGMIFLPRTEYAEQEKSKTIIEQVLIENDFYRFPRDLA